MWLTRYYLNAVIIIINDRLSDFTPLNYTGNVSIDIKANTVKSRFKTDSMRQIGVTNCIKSVAWLLLIK